MIIPSCVVRFVKSLVHKKPLQRLWGSALLHCLIS
nr:MAG TPA: hypothetical protein [Caudoviricetes sp.]